MSQHKALINELFDDNLKVQTAALQQLFILDEDAINPLLDAYYAGVNEAQGTILIEVLAQIGGYEALNALRTMLFFDLTTPATFRLVAANGLLLNSDNLSANERAKITKFIAENS